MPSMVTLLLLLGACSSHRAPEQRPPDLVIYLVDTMRADHLSVYGHERPTSPNIQAFAEESVLFRRAISHSGWTLASTASLLTGLYPVEHLATRDPDDPLRFNRLSPSTPTLASRLKAAGYVTAAFVDNVFLAPEFGLQSGFDVYDFVGAGGTDERSASDTVAAALAWMSTRDEPCFAYIHVMEPHMPYMPPAHLRGRFTGPGPAPVPTPFAEGEVLGRLMTGDLMPSPRQKEYIEKLYDEEILAADEAFGELVAGLREQGRWDRSVVAVTADHGEEFWEHGGFEHGQTLYGELLRVPLLVKGLQLGPRGQDGVQGEFPLDDPSGRQVTTQVQLADLFQTFLALAGQEAPAGTHGDDLRRSLWDPAFAATTRPVLSEDCLYGPPRVAITSLRYRFILNLESRNAAVLQLDDVGQNDKDIDDEATARQLGRQLFDDLIELRGDVRKHRGTAQTARIDSENMEKLRALGYVE